MVESAAQSAVMADRKESRVRKGEDREKRKSESMPAARNPLGGVNHIHGSSSLHVSKKCVVLISVPS